MPNYKQENTVLSNLLIEKCVVSKVRDSRDLTTQGDFSINSCRLIRFATRTSI